MAKQREEDDKRNAVLMGEIAALQAKLQEKENMTLAPTVPAPVSGSTETDKENGDELKGMLQQALSKMATMEKALEDVKKSKGTPENQIGESSEEDDGENGDEEHLTTLEGQTAP